jgi:hypothetical protein
VIELTDGVRGMFLVTTERGTKYWFDTTRRVVRRVTDSSNPARLELRRDGETVDLVEIVTCTVGRPLFILINLEITGIVLTARESTQVTSIVVLVMRSTGQ